MVFLPEVTLEQDIFPNTSTEQEVSNELIMKGVVEAVYVKRNLKTHQTNGAYILAKGDDLETVRRELSILPFWHFFDFEQSKVDELLDIYR